MIIFLLVTVEFFINLDNKIKKKKLCKFKKIQTLHILVQCSIQRGPQPATSNIAMYQYNITYIFLFTHYLQFTHVI